MGESVLRDRRTPFGIRGIATPARDERENETSNPDPTQLTFVGRSVGRVTGGRLFPIFRAASLDSPIERESG